MAMASILVVFDKARAVRVVSAAVPSSTTA
jgi:hypothetical protein